MEIFGSSIIQTDLYGIMYEKYKNKCEWLSFFDFDEYLVMHFEKGKYIKLKEFLSNPLFNNCDVIEINWLNHGDNDLVYYDNRTLIERFTKPDYSYYGNIYIKTIFRGNLTKKVFGKSCSHHQGCLYLKRCDCTGKKPKRGISSIRPPNHKYAYIMHYKTKTAEEFVTKIIKGVNGNDYKSFPLDKRIDQFFKHNKLTEEKLKLFERVFNKTFDKYHKLLDKQM